MHTRAARLSVLAALVGAGAMASQACGSDDAAAPGTGGSAGTGGNAGAAGSAGTAGTAGALNWTESVGAEASGTDGMVVSSSPTAARVGADILKRGGNAVDAAIAVQFALNVAEPMMSGIGGGCFMVVYDKKTGMVRVVSARERAPAGATPDMFLDSLGKPLPFSQRVTSGKSIGVPGTAKAMQLAHDQWGTLPWKELLAPAITLAKDGIVVGGRLAQSISGSFAKLDPAARMVFAPSGTPLTATDTLVQTDLANTLSSLADSGVGALYSGPVAAALAGVSQTNGGSMTVLDLIEYEKNGAEIVSPVEASIGALTMRSAPPPSSGGIVAAQVLGMLETLGLDQHAHDSTQKFHLQTEASRLAYADRFAHIGDPRFVNVPITALISPKYIAARAALINLSAANPSPAAGDPLSVGSAAPMYVPDAPVHGHTTHFTVADRFGNVVALTSTIEQVFGSGHMVPGYGFMLNNELTDFSAVPGGPNQVEGGKAPVSSMTPMIVFKDGAPVFTLGAAGGLTIITSVFQTFNNLVSYNMSVRDAVEAPRTFGALYPDISWENGVPQAARSGLTALGHSVDPGPSTLSNLQAMTIDASGFHGAADSSAPDGVAIGLSLLK